MGKRTQQPSSVAAAAKKRQRLRGAGGARSSSSSSTATTTATIKPSPFDRQQVRPHYAVLNQPKRGLVRDQNASNARALAKRKQSLLAELQQSDKSNVFIDKRIGERDAELDAEDKMIQRFQKERTRSLSKKSVYQLGEGDNDGSAAMELTHRGQSIGSMSYDDMDGGGRMDDDDGRDDDEDSANGRLGREMVNELHFGGGKEAADAAAASAAAPNAEKTKKEIMEDIIMKSKMHRAEKAKLMSEQHDRLTNLDTEFDSIRALMNFASKSAKRGGDGNGDDDGEGRDSDDSDDGDDDSDDNDDNKKSAHRASKKKRSEETAETDDFLLEARRLAEERTAKAVDRLKSPEEVAREEKLRLENLERERVRRMAGEVRGEDEDDDDDLAAGKNRLAHLGDDNSIGSRRKRRREAEKQAKREAREAAELGANSVVLGEGEGDATRSRKAKKARTLTDDDLTENFVVDREFGGDSGDDDEEEEEVASSLAREYGAQPVKRSAPLSLADDEEDDDDDGDEEDDDDGDEEDDDEEDDDEADDDDDEEEDEEDISNDPEMQAIMSKMKQREVSFSTTAPSVAPGLRKDEDGVFSLTISKKITPAASTGVDSTAASLPRAAAAALSASASSSSSHASPDDDMSVPFMFPAPASFAAFRAILAPYPVEKHMLIIKRLLACHSISLGAENRPRVEKIFEFLVLYVHQQCKEYSANQSNQEGASSQSKSSSTISATTFTALLARLDFVTRTLVELSESMPGCAGRVARERIEKLSADVQARVAQAAVDGYDDDVVVADVERERERDQLRNRRASSTASSASPLLPSAHLSAADLMLAKLFVTLFPSSDFRHNVTTPLQLLVASALSLAPVRGPRDVMSTLFTVQLLLHDVQDSRRLVPELLDALHAMLVCGFSLRPTPVTYGDKATAQRANHPFDDFVPQPVLKTFAIGRASVWTSLIRPEEAAKHAEQENGGEYRLPLSLLFYDTCCGGRGSSGKNDKNSKSSKNDKNNPFETERFRFGSLLLWSRLVHQAFTLYEALPSAPELFAPILTTLNHVYAMHGEALRRRLPASVESSLSFVRARLLETLTRKAQQRVPLVLTVPPEPIKMQTPNFVESFQPGRDYDPVRERAETREVARKMKREKRGAMKELRKDTAFIVNEEAKVAEALQAEGRARRKLAWQQLEEQQRDTNILHKLSKKEKKNNKKK